MVQAHGITTETVHRFFLDAGAVYLNYGEVTERLLGATRGGNSYIVEQDVRIMEMDGAKGPVKGGRRIVGARARIVANLVELTAENLKIALVAAESAAYPSEFAKTHDAITRNRDIVDADYLANVTIVGKISGADEFLVGIIKNVIAGGNLEIKTTDKDEAVLAVTFDAHFDLEDLETEPWEVRFPVIVEGT